MQNAERCSPTPPSDAGTSERETGEPRCSLHNHAHNCICDPCIDRGCTVIPSSSVDALPLAGLMALVDRYAEDRMRLSDSRASRREVHEALAALCGKNATSEVATPQALTAAPAAEGPRAERVRCPCCHDGGKPVPSSGTRYQYDCLQCGHDWTPAAALPGAEAPDDLCARCGCRREAAKHSPSLWGAVATAHEFQSVEQADYIAALTSEVRALTEQRDAETALLDVLEAWRSAYGSSVAGDIRFAVPANMTVREALAARLASPSPTGAP